MSRFFSLLVLAGLLMLGSDLSLAYAQQPGHQPEVGRVPAQVALGGRRRRRFWRNYWARRYGYPNYGRFSYYGYPYTNQYRYGDRGYYSLYRNPYYGARNSRYYTPYYGHGYNAYPYSSPYYGNYVWW